MVLWVLLQTLFLTFSMANAQSIGGCGIYEITGKLKLNRQHQFIIDIHEGTREKREIMVLSRDAQKLFVNVGQNVTAEALQGKYQHPQNESNIVLLQKISRSKKAQGVRLVKKVTCN